MADDKATETITPTIASVTTVAPVVDDAEARYAKLEEEKENYRKAYLKSETARKSQEDSDAPEDSRMEEVARKVLADSRLAEIAREQDTIIQKTLKENKELKLANLNKTGGVAASVGSSTESTPVRDTLVTPDQSAAFKAKGWTDKDIERYKKNLQKNSR